MSFTSEEFPWTSFYKSDLREILKRLRDIDSALDEYDKVIEELKAELTKLGTFYTRVEALEKATADLGEIRLNIKTLQGLCEGLAAVDKGQQVQIDELFKKVADGYSDLNTQIKNVYEYIDTKVDGVSIEWYKKYIQLQYLMNKLAIELEDKIDSLEEKLDWYIGHTSVDVFNPIAHERMTFDDNNKQAYVDLRDLGMTYAELSARKLSYELVQKAHWTYRTWATRGRKEVTHSDVNLFSPLSGRWTNWAEALSHVVGFVYGSLSYGELEKLQKTYEELEDMTYADLIRWNYRSLLTYGDVSKATVHGTNLIGF